MRRSETNRRRKSNRKRKKKGKNTRKKCRKREKKTQQGSFLDAALVVKCDFWDLLGSIFGDWESILTTLGPQGHVRRPKGPQMKKETIKESAKG